MAKTGIHAFIDLLVTAGVDTLFGNPGTTELPLSDALVDDQRIRYILGLQEVPVMAMADGYAMASRPHRRGQSAHQLRLGQRDGHAVQRPSRRHAAAGHRRPTGSPIEIPGADSVGRHGRRGQAVDQVGSRSRSGRRSARRGASRSSDRSGAAHGAGVSFDPGRRANGGRIGAGIGSRATTRHAHAAAGRRAARRGTRAGGSRAAGDPGGQPRAGSRRRRRAGGRCRTAGRAGVLRTSAFAWPVGLSRRSSALRAEPCRSGLTKSPSRLDEFDVLLVAGMDLLREYVYHGPEPAIPRHVRWCTWTTVRAKSARTFRSQPASSAMPKRRWPRSVRYCRTP